MIVRTWSKVHTQQAIKVLRTEGYLVFKSEFGYECVLNGELLFQAMVGNSGYLVRYNENLYI